MAAPTPFRYVNGHWEFSKDDGKTWSAVNAATEAVLKDYTLVEEQKDGSLTFFSEDRKKSLTDEQVLAQVNSASGGNVKAPVWWTPEVESAFGAYPPPERDSYGTPLKDANGGPIPNGRLIAAARAYAASLGVPGAAAEKPLEVGHYRTIDEAAAQLRPGWHVEDAPGGGYRLAPDVQRAPRPPSVNEELDRLILSGDFDRALQLSDIRDAVERRSGRLSPIEAARMVIGVARSPEEARRWIDALTQPYGNQQSPQTLPGPQGQPGNINVGGFYGPTLPPPPSRPFPAFPDRLGVPGGVGPQNPFGAAANPNEVLARYQTTQGQQPTEPFQAPPVATPPTQPVATTTQPMTTATQLGPQGAFQVGPVRPSTVEQFDPNYQGASPEARAQIEREFQFRQREGETGYQLTESPDFMAALRAREAQLRGPITTENAAAANAASGGVSTPGPAGQVGAPQTFQEAYEAQGGAARRGVFQVPFGMNPFDAAIALGKTPEGLATTAAINAVTPEERQRMAEEAMASPGYVKPQQQGVLNPFEQALYEREQRLQEELERLRQSRQTGMTVFQ